MNPCTAHEDGVCGLHKEEVERRISLRKTVDRVMNKLNWILGVMTLGTVIVVGNYIYTNNVRIDNAHRDEILTAKLDQLTSVVSVLASAVAVSNEGNRYEHKTLTKEIEDLNQYNKGVTQ